MNYKPYYFKYLVVEQMYQQLYEAYNELLDKYNDLYNRNDNDVKIYQMKK